MKSDWKENADKLLHLSEKWDCVWERLLVHLGRKFVLISFLNLILSSSEFSALYCYLTRDLTTENKKARQSGSDSYPPKTAHPPFYEQHVVQR